jgi:hypothetical protein
MFLLGAEFVLLLRTADTEPAEARTRHPGSWHGLLSQRPLSGRGAEEQAPGTWRPIYLTVWASWGIAQCCVLAHRGREPEYGWGDRPGDPGKDRGLEHSYIHADAHGFPDPDGYVHPYPHTDRHAHSHADIHPYAHAHSDPDGDSHPHGNSYPHANTDLHPYTHAHTFATHSRWCAAPSSCAYLDVPPYREATSRFRRDTP